MYCTVLFCTVLYRTIPYLKVKLSYRTHYLVRKVRNVPLLVLQER